MTSVTVEVFNVGKQKYLYVHHGFGAGKEILRALSELEVWSVNNVTAALLESEVEFEVPEERVGADIMVGVDVGTGDGPDEPAVALGPMATFHKSDFGDGVIKLGE